MKINRGIKKLTDATNFAENYDISKIFVNDLKNDIKHKHIFYFYSFMLRYMMLKDGMSLNKFLTLNNRIYSTHDENVDFIFEDITNCLKKNKSYSVIIKSFNYFHDENIKKIIDIILSEKDIHKKSKMFYEAIIMCKEREEIISYYQNKIEKLDLELSYIFKIALLPEMKRADLISYAMNNFNTTLIHRTNMSLKLEERKTIEDYVLSELDYHATVNLFYNNLVADPASVITHLIEKNYDISKFILLVSAINCEFPVDCLGDLKPTFELAENHVIEYSIKMNQPQWIKMYAKEVIGVNIKKLSHEILKFDNENEIYQFYRENHMLYTDAFINRLIELKATEKLIEISPFLKEENIEKVYYYLAKKGNAKEMFEFSKNCSREYLVKCEEFLKEKDEKVLDKFYSHHKSKK